MKKILLASTALAFASSAAMAAEAVTGSVGGYMFMGVGLSDANSSGDTELGVLRDSEIHLKFSGSSDNGLTFDGRVELEAGTTSDQIDENWGRVRGSFGEVLIGSNDTAGDRYGDVGIIYGPGARIAYFDGFAVNQLPQGGSADGIDALGIHYATPNFSGFTAAISYHPNGDTDDTRDSFYGFSSQGPGNSPNDIKEIISVAANYRGDFESFGFAVGGDYTVADEDDNLEVWSLGAEVSFSGFTVGLHYEKDETETGLDGDEDWAIGAEYKTGPWTFGGGYSFSENAPRANGKGGTSDIDSLAGWVVYDISPGVRWTAGVEYGDQGQNERYDAKTFLDIRF